MKHYEDLFIKICEDFHFEVNPLIERINKESIKNIWFDSKDIKGKFYIIRDLLLSLNKSDFQITDLKELEKLLHLYKLKLQGYWEDYPVATCLIFINPENSIKIETFINSIGHYWFNQSSHYNHLFTAYFIGIGIIGFPQDCYFKSTARLQNKEIYYEDQFHPKSIIEIEKGKSLTNPDRTSDEQDKLNYSILGNYRDEFNELFKEQIEGFKNFSNITRERILRLFQDFDYCITLCNTIIETVRNDFEMERNSNLEKIFTVLRNGYITDEYESFTDIFNPTYSGNKLIWLKSGPELKYFVDQLNGKMKLSNNINIWISQRFIMKKPITDMLRYLGKQTNEPGYDLLIKGLKPKDPLYLLFKE